MKALIATFIAALILVSFAAPNAYAHRHKHHKKHVHHHAYLPRYAEHSYGHVPRRQIEYDSRTLPFGSQIWWQQKDRERGGGRGGR